MLSDLGLVVVTGLAVGVVIAAFALAEPARADEPFTCRHTTECGARELCIADTLESSWGHCRAVRVLP